MPRFTIAVLVAIAFSSSAHATSFFKYCEHRVADVDNDYYFVVKRNDPDPNNRGDAGPVTITIAQRKRGSEPVADMKAAEDQLPTSLSCVDPKIWVRGGDTILGQIQLDRAPRQILMRRAGKGIVAIDGYGFNLGNHAGLSITTYSCEGNVLNRMSRESVIDLMEEVHRGDGYINWFDYAWIDEKRNELVFVGLAKTPRGGPRVTVSMNLTDGEVKKAGMELVERAFNERNPNALTAAFDLVRRDQVTGFEKYWPQLLDDAKSSPDHRIRAADLLAATGDRRGIDLIKRTAVEPAGTLDRVAQGRALVCLKNVAPDEATELIATHVRKNPEFNKAAWWAIYNQPAEKCVPVLRKLLDRKESVGSRLFAIDCIRAKGSEAAAAVPELIQILEDKDQVQPWLSVMTSTHACAAYALRKIGRAAEAAVPILIKRAEETAPEEWARVKDNEPEINPETDRYSKNDFIEAILRIRQK